MNLLLRTATALFLLPVLLWAFYVGQAPLYGLLAVLLGFSLWEYACMLCGRLSHFQKWIGFLYIFSGIASLAMIREFAGFEWVLLAFIATWSNDTFAYFAGRAFGKHLMAPTISAKKTWEGFLGGALGTLSMPFLLHSFLPSLSSQQLFFASLPCVLLAPAGDLLESKVKRLCQVKDSSTLLPGHGGFLDRIDALLLTSPWILLYALSQ
ncbi:MAG: phosphatidate cytidylyltransferase [Myxococcaceae bacterium]|nr:phosphatidate cytidylyltransferase [Myxococcaceae bacterium]MBH2006283.1 phosphatidate cytidylyltransferase [Myxococcaceae bacterium]